MKKFLPATLLAITTLVAAPLSYAAYLLPGGDFESGDFFGWVPSSSLGGISEVVYQGTCYSGNDTTGISFFGDAAAKLRSNEGGQIESGASITSEVFTAGSAISFAALSEVPFGQSSEHAVSLLDVDDNEIMSHRIERTGSAVLTPGCPNAPANGEFTGHLIDTNLFEGQEVKVRFKQSTNRAGFGLFTLVDDVFVYEPVEFQYCKHLCRAQVRDLRTESYCSMQAPPLTQLISRCPMNGLLADSPVHLKVNAHR